MLSFLFRAIARIRAVFQARDYDGHLDEELQSHFNLLVEDHIRRGTPPHEAGRRARIEMGGVTQLREDHRAIRGLPFLETIIQDLRYTFRTLRHNLGFAIFSILIVSFGIGASSTIFSVVNTLLLRPLPFSDARRLVWIGNLADDGAGEWSVQVGHFLDLREQTKSFSDLAAYYAFSSPGDAKITFAGATERLSSLRVSQNFFAFLGVHPLLGRDFNDDECRFNSPGAAILSHGSWKRLYNSDPGVIGRTLTINGALVTIVGVAPLSFDFATVFSPGNQVDVYLPMPLTPETNRFGNILGVIGRMKPAVTIQSARAEFEVLAEQIQRQHPDRNSLRPVLTSLDQHVTGRLRRAFLVLSGAVGMMMLIVCANVANLQLARGATRKKELAVRVAIGAGRGRLIRQMLTESVVLSCCGGLLGVFLAILGTRLLAGLQAFNIPLLATVKMDAVSLIFSLLMAILTGLLFGLAPAFQVPLDSIHDTLKDTSRGSIGGRRHNWIRSALVVSEVVFACVLLVAAGLLTRSFLKVLDVNVGFQPERAAALRIDRTENYATQLQRNAYFNQVLERVRSLPGVSEAGLADVLPLAGDRSWGIMAKGQVYLSGKYPPEGFIRVISDGYLQAMGIPLVAGRGFSGQDTVSSEPVVVVNETLARTLWPGENAVGKILMAEGGGNSGRRVVGVVGDVRHRALEQDSGCEVYLPIPQRDENIPVYLIVRTTLQPAALASSVRVALHSIAPEKSGNEFKLLQGLVNKAVSPRQFVVLLIAGFSVFALMLAALGIYAVISYSVSQREAEMGIRMALGATAWDLQAGILLQTLKLAGLGMLIGSVVGWVMAQALRSLLFGVTFADPVTFGVMAVILSLAAGLAGYLPSLRVSRIDPMTALRSN